MLPLQWAALMPMPNRLPRKPTRPASRQKCTNTIIYIAGTHQMDFRSSVRWKSACARAHPASRRACDGGNLSRCRSAGVYKTALRCPIPDAALRPKRSGREKLHAPAEAVFGKILCYTICFGKTTASRLDAACSGGGFSLACCQTRARAKQNLLLFARCAVHKQRNCFAVRTLSCVLRVFARLYVRVYV